MKKGMGVPEGYYKIEWCVKCRGKMTKQEAKRSEKEKFLRLCDLCYNPIKESLKRCLPLMQKFSQR